MRNWTWRTIIQGIITEHHHQLSKEGSDKDIDGEYIDIIWHMILSLAGITDLNKVPILTDPEHIDVKVILTMYSLESFLFKRLNQSCRDQEV